LEEDDEFEEFEQEHWGAAEEDASDAKQWQDNWDDDQGDDKFVAQLREQLAKP
jgi:26 proteasome complex subunit DSS1